jgi:hypothetical protein
VTRDLRKFARQTNFRLVAGFLALAFLVGGGLIYYFWGWESALMGMVCMGLALLPAVIVWLVLALMGWIVRRSQE